MGFTSGEAYYEIYTVTRDQYSLKPLPFAERARIAEQFALDHGLLDGSYEMISAGVTKCSSVHWLDNLMVTWPVLIIQVMPSGEVGTVNVRPTARRNQWNRLNCVRLKAHCNMCVTIWQKPLGTYYSC